MKLAEITFDTHNSFELTKLSGKVDEDVLRAHLTDKKLKLTFSDVRLMSVLQMQDSKYIKSLRKQHDHLRGNITMVDLFKVIYDPHKQKLWSRKAYLHAHKFPEEDHKFEATIVTDPSFNHEIDPSVSIDEIEKRPDSIDLSGAWTLLDAGHTSP